MVVADRPLLACITSCFAHLFDFFRTCLLLVQSEFLANRFVFHTHLLQVTFLLVEVEYGLARVVTSPHSLNLQCNMWSEFYNLYLLAKRLSDLPIWRDHGKLWDVQQTVCPSESHGSAVCREIPAKCAVGLWRTSPPNYTRVFIPITSGAIKRLNWRLILLYSGSHSNCMIPGLNPHCCIEFTLTICLRITKRYKKWKTWIWTKLALKCRNFHCHNAYLLVSSVDVVFQRPDSHCELKQFGHFRLNTGGKIDAIAKFWWLSWQCQRDARLPWLLSTVEKMESFQTACIVGVNLERQK